MPPVAKFASVPGGYPNLILMTAPRIIRNSIANRVSAADGAAHDWYRFVLAFPPHLVRDYLKKFEQVPGDCVLDPFCGTGTTNVECKKLGIPSVGVEAHPMSCFASRVKVNWNVDPVALREHSHVIAAEAQQKLREEGMVDDDLSLFT